MAIAEQRAQEGLDVPTQPQFPGQLRERETGGLEAWEGFQQHVGGKSFAGQELLAFARQPLIGDRIDGVVVAAVAVLQSSTEGQGVVAGQGSRVRIFDGGHQSSSVTLTPPRRSTISSNTSLETFTYACRRGGHGSGRRPDCRVAPRATSGGNGAASETSSRWRDRW